MDEKKSFLIEHVDSLGQGVSKLTSGEGQDITFIPKTLPGESGICEVFQEKKKVSFALPINIENESKNRIKPECPHFLECGGCDFLHTTYEIEKNFKLQNLNRLFSTLIDGISFDYVEAPRRFSYRNRVQLHVKNEKIGFYSKDFKLIPVPNCKVIRPEIESSLKEIYNNPKIHLKNINPKSKTPQKIEIYHHEGKTHINYNKFHAFQGFTQVNQQVNELIQECILNILSKDPPSQNSIILDLFGGNGNLSRDFNHSTLVVDNYPNQELSHKKHQRFQSFDLFKTNVHDFMNNRVLKESCEVLILDPPRSGFKELRDWVNHLRPNILIYLSCNPGTQRRDLEKLIEDGDYKIRNLKAFDLFPGTHHIESLITLSL